MTMQTALAERRNPVVKVEDGKVFANSGDVANFFDKRHKDVLEAIDNLILSEPSLRERHFRPTQNSLEMPTGGLRTVRAFEMNRDGFTLLAMGFTGAKALKWKIAYIEAFNAMEAQLTPVANQFDMMRAVIDNLEANNQRLFSVEKAVENLGAHEDFKSIKAYAALIGRKITTKESGELGRQATALSRQEGSKIGRQPDEAFGFVNTYHREILRRVFDQRSIAA
jgi:Rha family phage regulatory protein